MEKTNLINDLMLRLDGQFSNDNLGLIRRELEIALKSYTVEKAKSELALTDETKRIAQTYLMARKIEGLSKGTLKQYGRTIDLFFSMIQKPITDITTNDVRLFLCEQSTHMNERSMENQRRFIRAFFQWCEDSDYIRKNPCKVIKAVKYAKREREPLSDIEQEKMRNACKDKRELAIFEVLLASGCRVSELITLKKSDIDFKTRDVKIFGKGKKERKTWINAKAEIALRDYLDSRNDDCEYVICSAIKPYKQICKETVEKVIADISERAGIGRVFPHKLRHTFATDALAKGMPIEQLMYVMGHESIETTLVYAKTTEESVKYNYKKYVG